MTKEYAFQIMDKENELPIKIYIRMKKSGVFIGCMYRGQSVEFNVSLRTFLSLFKAASRTKFTVTA